MVSIAKKQKGGKKGKTKWEQDQNNLKDLHLWPKIIWQNNFNEFIRIMKDFNRY